MVFFLTIHNLQDLLLVIVKPYNTAMINGKKYYLGFKSVLLILLRLIQVCQIFLNRSRLKGVNLLYDLDRP